MVGAGDCLERSMRKLSGVMPMFSIVIYMSVYICILLYIIYICHTHIYVKIHQSVCLYICQIYIYIYLSDSSVSMLKILHLTIYKLYINKRIFTFFKG